MGPSPGGKAWRFSGAPVVVEVGSGHLLEAPMPRISSSTARPMLASSGTCQEATSRMPERSDVRLPRQRLRRPYVKSSYSGHMEPGGKRATSTCEPESGTEDLETQSVTPTRRPAHWATEECPSCTSRAEDSMLAEESVSMPKLVAGVRLTFSAERE